MSQFLFIQLSILIIVLGVEPALLPVLKHDILGIVNGKATIINASRCVGHGACFHACPVQAITLLYLPHTVNRCRFEPLGQKRSGLSYCLRTSFAGVGLILNVVSNYNQTLWHIRPLFQSMISQISGHYRAYNRLYQFYPASLQTRFAPNSKLKIKNFLPTLFPLFHALRHYSLTPSPKCSILELSGKHQPSISES